MSVTRFYLVIQKHHQPQILPGNSKLPVENSHDPNERNTHLVYVCSLRAFVSVYLIYQIMSSIHLFRITSIGSFLLAVWLNCKKKLH